MKRTLFICLGLVVGVMIALGVSFMSRPIPPVSVTVKNNSQQPIALVRLEHERGVETLEHLARGEAKVLRFRAGGETSYRLRVRFADGSEVAGGGNYAEPGYQFLETVNDSEIATDLRLPAPY